MRSAWPFLLGCAVALLFVFSAFVPTNLVPRPAGAGKVAAGPPVAASGPAVAAGASGRALAQQLACLACHSVDGAPGVGPTWKGLYGSTVTLEGGQKRTADRDYLREKITNPDAFTVQGFPKGVMGPVVQQMKGQIEQDGNLEKLVDYIASLR